MSKTKQSLKNSKETIIFLVGVLKDIHCIRQKYYGHLLDSNCNYLVQ